MSEARNSARAERLSATLLLFKNPQLWQCWPRLPLTRYHRETGATDYGYFVDGGGAMVFEGLVFMEPASDRKRWEYDSVEAAIADGWLVD